MKQKYILSSVIPYSLISLIMNGLIVYFILDSRNQIEFSLESISLHAKSPLGISMYVAMILTIILSAISFLFLKKAEKKSGSMQADTLLSGGFWPEIFVIVLRNSIFAFGLIILLIELVQTRLPFGSVSLVSASALAGFISLVITGLTLYSTIDTILSKK
ncbi:MAG: hypothetical protein HOO86_09155 [Bacteroidales bacterium]|nr:hypothetical protein [Bacteroidales bacterium]